MDNQQLFYEDGHGKVVDEYGRPEPMDYLVDEETYALKTVNSHTQYLYSMPPTVKRGYTLYADQDKCPKTRAKTTTILGAISASGPGQEKKRGGHVALTSTGTVTGHYLSFLKATMDEMYKYPHMKGHCLVLGMPLSTNLRIFKSSMLIFHRIHLSSTLRAVLISAITESSSDTKLMGPNPNMEPANAKL
ncbi:hypothetical protein VTP01DRAFT_2935 [Rhizomucor pusillus]|uniref:uncharacterized protein n=1 Tax=Rhizomucor pusillus TaxID=4840 RepID=UPI0037443C6B